MKVLIDDHSIWIEDGPEPDPQLPEYEGQVVANLLAMTWAIGRIGEQTRLLQVAQNERAIAAAAANQAIETIRRGLH